MNSKGTNPEDQRTGFNRDQLMTIADMERFKKELIETLTSILTEKMAVPTKQWLRSTEVKKLLGISNGTLHTLRTSGALIYSKVGGTIFHDYNDIVRLIKDNEQR